MQSSNPFSVIDLSDFISVEDVTKKSKLFTKKEYTLQITTNRGAHLLLAADETDRDDWIQKIKDAATFAVCTSLFSLSFPLFFYHYKITLNMLNFVYHSIFFIFCFTASQHTKSDRAKLN
jgi:PH domain